MAGVAHEVKNPLNAMTIHLELLKQKLETAPAAAEGRGVATLPARGVDVQKHVTVIAHEIRRLDEVMIGFLKFARPDELRLQPVQLADLVSRRRDDGDAGGAQAWTSTIRVECPGEPARHQRRPRHAAAGAAEPGAQRLPGDAERRHAAHRLPVRLAPPRRDRRRRHRGRHRAGEPQTVSSISTSRPRKRAPASAYRWCTASSSCMTARSKCSRRRGAARASG